MKGLIRCAILLSISLFALVAQAQSASETQQENQASKTVAQDVLIIIEREQVRFTAQKSGVELQLQVFDQSGQVVYDSGVVSSQELIWVLQHANGEPVKSGLYAYSLSIKNPDAETPRVRKGHFIVDRVKDRDQQTDRLWITSRDESGVGTELTVATNEGVTVAGTGATTGERASANDRTSQDKGKTTDANAAPGTGVPGRIAKFTSTSDIGNSEIFETNAKLGIGTTNPLSKFHIASGASDILPPRLESPATNTFSAGWDFYHGATGVGYVGVPDQGTGVGPGEMLLYGVGTTSLWAGRQRSVVINPFGNVGIGIDPDIHRLRVHGNEILSTGNGAGFKFRNRGSNSANDDWVWYSQDNIARLWRANVGDVMSIDTHGRVEVGVLQITGGSDFAENFDLSSTRTGKDQATSQPLQPGLLVSIDPTNPGKLALSTKAYDRRVAGIISGAGGVKPGMVMNQEGTLAYGQHPVALSGRVYCWVDTSYGAVKPGDLLTTSNTPGYAMKATNAVKAHGAIIGKAMTGLKEGKGLVLVLVALQ